MLVDIFRRAFLLEQWKIGWSRRTIAEFLDSPEAGRNQWIEASDGLSILADPFGIEDAGRLGIFAESQAHGGSEGKIVFIMAGKPSASAHAISKPWHLSYPFLISEGGERFLVPEQAEAGCIAFYKVDESFQVAGDASWVLEGLPSLDPTFVHYKGRWWLFSTSISDSPQNTCLYLHYADTLKGPFTAHPANPIVRSIDSARPAGRVILLNGRLFRPGQNCASGYGASISVAEIIELSTTSYLERHLRTIRPSDLQGAFADGVHHLDHTEHYVLFDSKRFVFRWNAWWLKLKERSARESRSGSGALPGMGHPGRQLPAGGSGERRPKRSRT